MAMKKRSNIEVGISLQSKDQSTSYDLRNVLVTKRIPVCSEGVNISSYAHLKDFSYSGTNSVGISISQNYADLLLVHDIVEEELTNRMRHAQVWDGVSMDQLQAEPPPVMLCHT